MFSSLFLSFVFSSIPHVQLVGKGTRVGKALTGSHPAIPRLRSMVRWTSAPGPLRLKTWSELESELLSIFKALGIYSIIYSILLFFLSFLLFFSILFFIFSFFSILFFIISFYSILCISLFFSVLYSFFLFDPLWFRYMEICALFFSLSFLRFCATLQSKCQHDFPRRAEHVQRKNKGTAGHCDAARFEGAHFAKVPWL